MSEDEQRQLILKLSNETGRGLLDCKKALCLHNYDYDLARIFLNKSIPGVRLVNKNLNK